MMVRLLHMGAIDSINSLDHEGNTALHFAAANCEPEYVQVSSLSRSPEPRISVLVDLWRREESQKSK